MQLRKRWGSYLLAAAGLIGLVLIGPWGRRDFLWLTSDARYDLGASLLGGAIIGIAVLAIDASFQQAFQEEERRRNEQAERDRRQREEFQQRESFRMQLSMGREFPGIDLRGRNLRDFYLPGRNFTRARMENANLSDAILDDVNLTRVNLFRADLRHASLRDAQLVDAYLREADMAWARLEGADMRGASLPDDLNLSMAIYNSATVWPNDGSGPIYSAKCPGWPDCPAARLWYEELLPGEVDHGHHPGYH